MRARRDRAASAVTTAAVAASLLVGSACADDGGDAAYISQLQFAVDWAVPAGIEGLALSSGDIHPGHADFWNAWDPDKLRREVQHCLQRDLPCGVSG